jgi:multidrug efflux pump subunit AcrA (membrane-fusion protein)
MSIFKNKSRMITIGVSIALVLVAFAVVKALPSPESPASNDSSSVKGELVEVIYPQAGLIEQTFTATGKLEAFDRFEIFAQVDGQLLPSTRYFREGNSYAQGDIILEIDRREFEMTLLAQKSDFITLITSILPDLKSDYADSYPVWRAYVSAVDVTKSIPALPAFTSEQEKFYLAGKGIPSKYYNILSAEEKLVKYTIRAPFSGVVTSANVEAGTAVRNGSALGTIISNSAYDLEITVPLAMLQNIQVGTSANLTSSEIDGEWSGKVVRIGGDIDLKTQSEKLFIRTSGKNLKE